MAGNREYRPDPMTLPSHSPQFFGCLPDPISHFLFSPLMFSGTSHQPPLAVVGRREVGILASLAREFVLESRTVCMTTDHNIQVAMCRFICGRSVRLETKGCEWVEFSIDVLEKCGVLRRVEPTGFNAKGFAAHFAL